MAAISQTSFSNAFSWRKMYGFCLRFHWGLFLRLTIFHHWFRWWLGADQATSPYLNQWWLVYWCIYASLDLNDLRMAHRHDKLTQRSQSVMITPLLRQNDFATSLSQSDVFITSCDDWEHIADALELLQSCTKLSICISLFVPLWHCCFQALLVEKGICPFRHIELMDCLLAPQSVARLSMQVWYSETRLKRPSN